ncbi:Transglutaminaselike, partial [Caligus rogercresseyi]
CRAIGIPCRSVTKYESAHDTNENLTVEKYFDEEGNELGPRASSGYGSDSVWNFHVWNDVWMSRPTYRMAMGAGKPSMRRLRKNRG